MLKTPEFPYEQDYLGVWSAVEQLMVSEQGSGDEGAELMLCLGMGEQTPEIQITPRAQSLLYHTIIQFCPPECRQEPVKYLCCSQNCMRDHKQYIYIFSLTDKKIFSVESPDTVSNFLNRANMQTTTADFLDKIHLILVKSPSCFPVFQGRSAQPGQCQA